VRSKVVCVPRKALYKCLLPLLLAYCVCANFNDERNISALLFDNKERICSREIVQDCQDRIMVPAGPEA